MLDGHMGNSPTSTWTLETALAVAKALEEFQPLFFEEPLHYTDLSGYATLCAETKLPIAGGRMPFSDLRMAGLRRKRLLRHRPAGCGLFAGAGSIHAGGIHVSCTRTEDCDACLGRRGCIDAKCPLRIRRSDTLILEVPPDFAELHSELLLDGSFMMKDGLVLPPELPGLGIRLTDKIKQQHPFIPGSGEFNSVPGKVLVD